MEEDQNVFDISLLLDDLKSDQMFVRGASMKRLNEIASVLGVQRTQEELLPLLNDLIDSDDDVLVVMAQQLGDFIPHVGGTENSEFILEILERLCTMQEVTVREAATQSILKICELLSPEEIDETVYSMAVRMHNGEWFTSKICVCSLLPILYKTKQAFGDADTIVDMYDDLCKDPAPMIRKAAISIIPEFIKVMDKESCKVNLPRNLYLLVRDEQDSIRVCGNTACIALGSVLSEQDCIQLILPLFLELACDQSWRVRYTTVTQIAEICKLFPAAIIKEKLVPEFLRLMQDPELEVRTGAASSLSKLCAFLEPDFIVEQMMRIVGNLGLDTSEHVRIGLSNELLNLCSILGSTYTEQYILPVFKMLLQDVNTKVRLNLISTFSKIQSTLSQDLLTSTLLPTLVALKNDLDWRVRQSLLNYIPLLSQQLGHDVTYSCLRSILCDYTTDCVATIREDAIEVLRQLYVLYGESFADDTVFPTVSDLLHHEKYLLRITGIHLVASVGAEMPQELVCGRLLPMLMDVKDDMVANVRLNTAKAIAGLKEKVTEEEKKEVILPLLEKYAEDADRDVRYFAQESLKIYKQ